MIELGNFRRIHNHSKPFRLPGKPAKDQLDYILLTGVIENSNA